MNVRSLYYTPRWHGLRKRVKERDGFRCQKCGKAGRLEVHHIISARERPDLFFDLLNLATVCRSCHIELTKKERTGRAPESVRKWRIFRDELMV